MGSPPRAARTELLREILDVAIVVGRRVEADGRGSVPPPLRPVLSSARIGGRARAAADRAGDDDAFRALVAEAVAVDDLDAAGRLWLTRPEGWEGELDTLVKARIDADAGADAYRTLDRERRARRRAEADRDRAQTERDRLQAELAEVRSRLAGAEAEAATAVEERAAAVRSLKDMEALHSRAHEDLRAARAALDEAEQDRAAAVAPPPEAVDREAAAATADAAAAAAAELVQVLEALAADLRPPNPVPPAADPSADPPADTAPDTPADAAPDPPAAGPARRRRPRRVRPRLPGGLHDDTPEAAAHLVRLAGCTLVVDGYNATMALWPDHDLPEQRRRLVDALDQLEARVGVTVIVVFDGVEEAVRRSTFRRVDVRFTTVGVEADDVIIEMVDTLPDGPVVVASDDQRVRTGAHRRGAHAIGTAQLRSLLV